MLSTVETQEEVWIEIFIVMQELAYAPPVVNQLRIELLNERRKKERKIYHAT